MHRDDLLRILETDVVAGAWALLGATLVKGDMRARIVETEAYRFDDPACHAFGKTRMKNMAIFGTPGHAYVYFTYGNHWMFNVVARPFGEAGAVLIRAAEPLEGIDEMTRRRPVPLSNLLSGPGKLAQAMGIHGEHNGLRVIGDTAEVIQIEPAVQPVSHVITGPRIGIAAGKWDDVPWRFVDGDRLQWCSKPIPPDARSKRHQPDERKI